MRILISVLALSLTSLPALAYQTKPVADQVTKTECGACHMVYPAALLPARSWDALTNDLAHHFGEDASLAPDVAAGIKAYLMANAGDASGKPSGLIKRLPLDATPLRITELPRFVGIHGQFSPRTLKKIGTPGNCAACHQGAANGQFYDD
jgi:Dihaem cytochrome c